MVRGSCNGSELYLKPMLPQLVLAFVIFHDGSRSCNNTILLSHFCILKHAGKLLLTRKKYVSIYFPVVLLWSNGFFLSLLRHKIGNTSSNPVVILQRGHYDSVQVFCICLGPWLDHKRVFYV